MTERTELPTLATRTEAAASLRVSVRTVDRLIASGELHAIKAGRSVRIPLAALAAAAGADPEPPSPVAAPNDGPQAGEAPPIASPATLRSEAS